MVRCSDPGVCMKVRFKVCSAVRHIDENFQGISTLNSSMNLIVENDALWKNSKNMRQQG